MQFQNLTFPVFHLALRTGFTKTTQEENVWGFLVSAEIQIGQVLIVIYLNWLVSWVYKPWSRRTIWVTPASFFCTSTFPGWGSQCTYPSSNIILLYIFPIFLLTSSISIPASFSLINQSINQSITHSLNHSINQSSQMFN